MVHSTTERFDNRKKCILPYEAIIPNWHVVTLIRLHYHVHGGHGSHVVRRGNLVYNAFQICYVPVMDSGAEVPG